MQVNELKEYLLNNNLCEDVLTALGCGHVRNRGEYISASNPDGNNTQAIVLYLNESLNCIDYTRQLSKTKRATDIFDLVAYFRDCAFPEAMKWVCDTVGLDYYREPQDIPESLQILRMLKEMSMNIEDEDSEPVKPIPEEILNYYLPYGNVLFEDDGISIDTQYEWEISFDPQTNSICIPIRDELGTLIAVKARRFKYTPNTPMDKRRFPDELEEDESKYFFLQPGPKSAVLYGLYKNAKAIQRQGVVFVGESEKFTLQLYDMGYYGVSTGGSKVSKKQVELLTRLAVKIVFCFDKDIGEEELRDIVDKFMDGIDVYAIIDKDNILDEKESPSDDPKKWSYLIKNNIYKISKGGDTDDCN